LFCNNHHRPQKQRKILQRLSTNEEGVIEFQNDDDHEDDDVAPHYKGVEQPKEKNNEVQKPGHQVPKRQQDDNVDREDDGDDDDAVSITLFYRVRGCDYCHAGQRYLSMIAESILWNREICNDMKDWVNCWESTSKEYIRKRGGMDLFEQIQE
jgi:glutaredoxin